MQPFSIDLGQCFLLQIKLVYALHKVLNESDLLYGYFIKN